MKKFCLLSLLLLVFAGLVFSMENVGTRTAQSSPYPVLFEETAPTAFPNDRYSYVSAWLPRSSIQDEVKLSFAYLMNAMSYYALSDAAINRQIAYYERTFLEGSTYILEIFDGSFPICILTMAMRFDNLGQHQLVVNFRFSSRPKFE